METSLLSFSSSQTLPNPIRLPPLHPPKRPSFPSPSTQIRAAISRTKKEETISAVKTHLENCHLLAGINYQRFTVKQFQDLRKKLPPTVKLVVAKNTLVEKAVEGTPWAAMKPCFKGMNVWMFVHTEEIPKALKPYREFQKERKLENEFTGAVFEGKFYGPGEFKGLETMPSREEVYSKLLGCLQSPAMSLVGTLQAPARDLVFTLNAYVKKLEEEQGVVGSS